MSRVRAAGALVVGIVLLVFASNASAMDCQSPPPLCEAFWKYGAVFDGTVVRVEPTESEGIVEELQEPAPPFAALLAGTLVSRRGMVPRTRVTYRVNQAWSGVTTGEVQMIEDRQGPRLGSRWLILAYKNADGTLNVNRGECGVSVPYESAGQELAFLASMTEPSRQGRVFGRIWPQRNLPTGSLDPIQVTLTGEGVNRSITTRDEFTFDDLPIGAYTVQVTPPVGLRNRGTGVHVVRLDPPNGCKEVFPNVEPTGAVEGMVLRPDGRPAVSQRVALMPADEWLSPRYYPSNTESTDADGHFRFDGVARGSYVLGVPVPQATPGVVRGSVMETLGGQPDKPDVIGVADVPVSIRPMRLPALPELPVIFQFRWPDGTPVSELAVRIDDVTWSLPEQYRGWSGVESDASGRATFRLLPSHRYSVSVWAFPTASRDGVPGQARRAISVPTTFTVDPGQSELVVVVEPVSR